MTCFIHTRGRVCSEGLNQEPGECIAEERISICSDSDELYRPVGFQHTKGTDRSSICSEGLAEGLYRPDGFQDTEGLPHDLDDLNPPSKTEDFEKTVKSKKGRHVSDSKIDLKRCPALKTSEGQTEGTARTSRLPQATSRSNDHALQVNQGERE